MNAASEMSVWLVIVTTFLFQIQLPSINSFSTVYRHSETGRKLFGGYRIVPKPCTVPAEGKGSKPKTGTCMFNYECNQRGGEMIGSCIDGFLFGVCCALPKGAWSGEAGGVEGNGVEGGVTGASRRPTYSGVTGQTDSPTPKFSRRPEFTSESTSVGLMSEILTGSEEPDELIGALVTGSDMAFTNAPPKRKPILEQYFGNHTSGGFIDNQGFLPVHTYPGADTILLNPDGTLLEDDKNPELFTPPRPHFPKPTTTHTKPPTPPPNRRPPAPPNPSLFPLLTHRPPNTPQHLTPASLLFKKTDSPPTTPKTYPTRPTPTDNMVLVHTLLNNPPKRPTTTIPLESTQSTSKASYKPSYITTRKPPKPTPPSTLDLDHNYPSFNYDSYTGISKPPILISHPVGLDDGGQAISHIIGILNTTNPPPDHLRPATRPLDPSPALSTWLSITADANPSPPPKPSTATTTYVHGPSFSVEPNPNKPAPTVVVISPDTPATPYYPPKLTPSPTHTTPFYHNNVLVTGQENLINFPPVRNPDLNASGLGQVEKPTVVHTYDPSHNDLLHLPNGIALEVLPDNADLNTVDPDDDYADFTTPALHDDKLHAQVHTFVEKIVNSLAGNFQDLENILFTNNNQTTITNPNGIQLNNIHIGDPTDNPTTTPPPTKKPTRKPTTTKPYDTTLTDLPTTPPNNKTKPTLPPTTLPTRKPSTPTPTKRPSPSTLTPTKRPTTLPPTKKPSTTTTTTKRPTPPKRPKPPPSTTTPPPPPTPLDDTQPTTTEPPHSSAETTLDYRKECGVRPLVKKGGRIVGGKGSQFGSYPWQVLVRESTWLGLFTKNKCGGVLITNRYVITAAHCQPGFLASLVAVFGEFDISGELESKRSVAKNVRRVIVHRQYDPATFENDLALLELDSPVSYDEHIVPICMPREGEDYVGRMATVTGWGRLKYGGGVPSVLQEVRVPLIENSVCQEMFQTAGHQKRIISSFLCAGYANGQKDSCEGDSGGPLMVEREDGRWVLLGTVSHGIKCAAPYLPGVYMRTTYYKPWLKSITGVST